ncbi:hypothetical protein B9Z55_021618 [Caenorhabditis nigoni]|uniref:F-box domain-containing protein n=1 Tax=Caenorhabditis nigoni TaxID=1611254 RepID=A0A2G5TSX5_9PELO|nr:hypothetical protein B9Z55_021618 [Caenorhabditis nigoni]
MPIRVLSLPVADLQYVLECVDTCDLIAFSLCSKRTKNLVTASKRTIHSPTAYVFENYIHFVIREYTFPQDFNFELLRQSFQFHFYDKGAELADRCGVWKKQEFTQKDWIAHFLKIFHQSTIHTLGIVNTSLSYLDTIKQFFPRCHRLFISADCSKEFTKIAFFKLFPIAEKVEFKKNIFDDENDISKVLTQNFKSLSFKDHKNPLKLTLDNLLVLNITDLTIDVANISEKELNRFLKLWMKGNHTFYRPKVIKLSLEHEIEINCEEVFKGIKYEDVQYDEDDFPTFRLMRGDGKEIQVFIADNYIDFEVV